MTERHGVVASSSHGVLVKSPHGVLDNIGVIAPTTILLYMNWTDEAMSTYTPGATRLERYLEDLDILTTERARVVALENASVPAFLLMHVAEGFLGANKLLPEGQFIPSFFRKVPVSRPTTFDENKDAFLLVLPSVIQPNDIVFVDLNVDISGSLGFHALGDGFTEFRNWLANQYPDFTITTVGVQERWLMNATESLRRHFPGGV